MNGEQRNSFRFKQFEVDDCGCGMKVGTDSVLLGAWTCYDGATSICDVGAGSGLLSLMAAQKARDAHILALEIDSDAVKAAAHNFALSPWSVRLRVVNADALTYVPDATFDLIITNPPYFTSETVSPDSQRAQARHANGMLGALSVIRLASQWLSDDGTVAMVTPAELENELIFEAEMQRLKLWRQCYVHTVERKAPKRILWQFSRAPRTLQKSHLIIRRSDAFSDDYVTLTEEFYLKFP